MALRFMPSPDVFPGEFDGESEYALAALRKTYPDARGLAHDFDTLVARLVDRGFCGRLCLGTERIYR